MTDRTDTVVADTRRWLERAVIGLNLCPFAKAVHQKRQIGWQVSRAASEAALADDLRTALRRLAAASPSRLDTVLLIHPQVLQDFADYNDFLDVVDVTVHQLGLAGRLQVASFHPQYQFEGTDADDITNATNRSPYPTLHLIRESSIDRAVAAFPEAESIYEVNMATMRRLGPLGWDRLRQQCRDDADEAAGG